MVIEYQQNMVAMNRQFENMIISIKLKKLEELNQKKKQKVFFKILISIDLF